MLSVQLLIVLAFVSTAPRVALAQEVNSSVENNSWKEKIVIQSFLLHGKDRLLIVRELQATKQDYEKHYKKIALVVDHAVSVIKMNRDIISEKQFIPGDNQAFENATVGQALSDVLHSSALFGDVILHFPEITKRILRSQKHYNSTLDWGLKFINQTQHLMDQQSIKKLDLVHQELYMIPRRENYTNPYHPSSNEKKIKTKSKKESKREPKKRGPRLVDNEF